MSAHCLTRYALEMLGPATQWHSESEQDSCVLQPDSECPMQIRDHTSVLDINVFRHPLHT